MRYSGCIFLIPAFLAIGCATVFNGSTQNVPVQLDEGTTVYDTSHTIYPLYRSPDNVQYIKLKRKYDYPLTFSNGTDSAFVYMESSMEGAWIIPDFLFTYGIGLVVDAVNGAWYSFDGVSVHFTKPKASHEHANIAISGYDPAFDSASILFRKKTGLIARLGVELVGPVGGDGLVFLGNGFTLGLGYKLFSDLHIYADYSTVSYLDSHPHNSNYYSNSSLKTYEAGFRFFPTSGIYLTAGLGYGHVTTDSVYNLRPNDHSRANLMPSQGHLGTATFGVGHAGSIGFIELQARWGTNGFYLSSGERGRLYSIGLHYGLNLSF